MGNRDEERSAPRAEGDSHHGQTVVVAFGGNAILRADQVGTAEEQFENLTVMADQLALLMEAGWSVVATHGNGPQVGNIKLQQDAAEPQVPGMPLDVCGAMSQGQLGYLLAMALSNIFAKRGIDRRVVAVLTRCLISLDDPAMACPSKPIGPFYDEAEAALLRRERGWTVVQDANRGLRRVVPSPAPQKIVELNELKVLLSSGALVVALGGGGVPVVACDGGGYRGVEAVIDKDLAASLLARELEGDALVLLTAVDQVYLDYGKPTQRGLTDVTVNELERLAEAGQFPAGSMGPKIAAAVEFLRAGGDLVTITSPDHLVSALQGMAGTRVHGSRSRATATTASR